MTLLTVIAAVWHLPLLTGYLIGAAMHLAFDIAVNGDYALRNRYLFYVFGYRATKGFKAAELLEKVAVAPGTGSHPFREFFAWRPPVDRPRRSERVADFNSASDLDPL
jgi:hypothetical protein